MAALDEEIARIADESVRLYSDIEFDVGTANSVVRYLIGRARRESRTALLAILNADPTNLKEVARLQSEALRFVEIVGWLVDAVNEGHKSNEMLRMDQSKQEESIELLGLRPDELPKSTYGDE